MWENLGFDDLASTNAWPDVSGDEVDMDAMQSEELLKKIIEDIANILKITKMENPTKIVIYTASSFKSKAYSAILKNVVNGNTDMGKIMQELIANPENCRN